MAVLKCKMCGGTIEFEPGATVGMCDSCGTKQTLPNVNDEVITNLHNRANTLRLRCDFDKAEDIYNKILENNPNDAEAHWGVILCKYGIEYVEDPKTFKRVPTCHRTSFEAILADEDYKAAIANGDMAQRQLYEAEAAEIDRIQKDILAIVKNEKPFDIFICYKETDENGKRTQDSVIANDIYYQLTQEGFKVFYAAITLEDKLGQEYEPYIFAALNSAKVMLVVGSKPEYFSAVWVKNEWSRFLKLMKTDRKKMLIPCYRDMDAYELPEDFAHLQAQDMSKIGFINDLVRGIKKVASTAEIKPEAKENAAEAQSTTANAAPLLKRAFMFLEDGNFKDADEYCEKVLDMDPENAQAYLGKLMAELRVKKQDDLKDCAEPFDGRNNYQKVIRFGNSELKEELESHIGFINDRKEKARQAELKAEAEKKEKAEKERAEAESILNQLIEALKNDGKTETTQQKLESAKKKKTELETEFKDFLAQSEKDKQTVRSKTEELNGSKEKLQSMLTQKNQIEKDISALEAQRASLGLFAISQKKTLAEQITQKTSEKNALDEQIKPLEKQIATISAALGKLGTCEEIDKKTEIEKIENAKKVNAAEVEISRLEAKLAEEQEKGSAALSIEEIVKVIKEKKYIADCIIKIIQLKKLTALHFSLQAMLGLPVTFGKYPQTKRGEDNTPIEWQILAKENGKALIISKYALDCPGYNSSYTDITWEKCSLRKWLNGTFLNNAFSTDEQKIIATTNVSADEISEYSTNPGNATTDKVFLLSITEAEKYFTSDEARKCAPTAYAEAQGAYTDDDCKTAGGEATCGWWLRSPGDGQDRAAYVNIDGSVNCSGSYVDDDNACVRPALWINLES